MSRVDDVAKNMKFAVFCQIATGVVNFAVRRVFAMVLEQDYLGINGLFADILSMLSLAELGFGTSILFSLYKPVAEGDTEKIKSLMALYRTAYRIIGLVVLGTGLALTPFLEWFVKEMPEGIPHIHWIYVLHVVNSALSYFFIYKATLLFACQQKYVEILVTTVVKTAAGLLQIGALLLTGNYFLYLAVMLSATLVQNAAISLETDRRYPYLRERNVSPLARADKQVIFRNVAAMMFHKFGDVAVFSTDSILMAKFVSVAAVGLYSNYMLIRKTLVMVIDMLFSAITASMGNLNASEAVERKRTAFQHVNFLAAWLFGWMSICLLWLYNPFIELWLGADYLFPMEIVALIVVNFYLYCMRIPVGSTKNAMGLFWNDRYKPIAEVAVNLVASVLLAGRMGIAGVLLGTTLSTVLVPFWIEPLVLFHRGLEQGAGGYFLHYLLYLAVTVAAGALTGVLCALAPDGMGGFAAKMLACATVPHLVYLTAYWRTENFRYLRGVALRLAGRALRRGGRGNG